MSDGSNSRLMFCSKKVITMNTLLHEKKLCIRYLKNRLIQSRDLKGRNRFLFWAVSTSNELYSWKVVCQHYTLSLMLKNVLSSLFFSLYASFYYQKERGVFQHFRFLACGATIATGRFTPENGLIKLLLRNSVIREFYYLPKDFIFLVNAYFITSYCICAPKD